MRRLVYRLLDIGRETVDLEAAKIKYAHLNKYNEDKIEFFRVKLILVQDQFGIIRPLEVLQGKGYAPYPVRTPLEWVLSGTLPGGPQPSYPTTPRLPKMGR
jgi:hypothetical protein